MPAEAQAIDRKLGQPFFVRRTGREGPELDLRLNRREQALVDEIRRATFLGELDLCRIAVRKLLTRISQER